VHNPDHLSGFLELPLAPDAESRTSLWRQAMATLAQAALEQQPVPLEGFDPRALQAGVMVALRENLTDDLDWLSAPAAAAAIYELAAALPVGDQRRQLGRHVLTRLYEGDAATFVVLATSLAAESKRTLTGGPIRARVALALELPLGSPVSSDALALALISRPDLRREWLSDPAMGSLPSRRLAARLLERAARETARRVAQGDAGSLRAFEEPAVQSAWRMLLADRESLVWRHVANARGLLSAASPDLADEIRSHLDPELSPTEWRRAAVSLVASIALSPDRATARCFEVLADKTLRRDPGLAGTMIFGLARAAEVEPEAAEELGNQIVRIGGFEGAEALVELLRERMGDVGRSAADYARDKLSGWLGAHHIEDDGRVALCQALIDELSPREQREPTLRDELDDALGAFVDNSAREAFARAQQTLIQAQRLVGKLEETPLDSDLGRRQSFRVMRELDVALLETSALGDLLTAGATARSAAGAGAPLGELFERMTNWLIEREGQPVEPGEHIAHATLRMRRIRTLLHTVDADGSYGEDINGKRRERRLRTARMLLMRARDDAPTSLRRIICAALARALDALVRDEICDLSDVIVALADHVPDVRDQKTLAEASMLLDFQRSAAAYAELTRCTSASQPGGRNARTALDALEIFAQSLPWASTLRVSAMRQGLLHFTRQLEAVAGARALSQLTESEPRSLSLLESCTHTIAQLTVGARRRIRPLLQLPTPSSGAALNAVELTIEHRAGASTEELADVVEAAEETLRHELPTALADAARLVLGRLTRLPATASAAMEAGSFVPPIPKEAPLPPWMPGRRILGGFYVLRALGTGGVGSVFVVTRAEERHMDRPVNFALKVPVYNAEAARTLSEDEFLALFREEAGTLLGLPRHRNLATFVTFDAGARPKPILVMELVEGPTLERVIERGELDMPRALSLLEGIGEGIRQMHRVGIAHLDIKPSNVILRTPRIDEGLEPTPVLVDFGLAGRHIRPGCATGPYGAPEIWGLLPDGYQPLPQHADVYAFCCLAYEVLTGQTLFSGASELAIINNHLSHDGYPESLLTLRRDPALTPLCDLIANGLRRAPADRISIEELCGGFRELAAALYGRGWPLRTTAAA